MRRSPLLMLALLMAVAGIVLLHAVGAPPIFVLGFAAVVIVPALVVTFRRRRRTR